MPSRTPKRALAAVFAAVPLVTCVFAVQGVCAEPPADVVVSFVDRPEPGYYSRTVIPTLAAMARAMPDRTVTGVRLLPDDPSADLMRLRPDILVGPASVYMELELNYGGHAIATRINFPLYSDIRFSILIFSMPELTGNNFSLLALSNR